MPILCSIHTVVSNMPDQTHNNQPIVHTYAISSHHWTPLPVCSLRRSSSNLHRGTVVTPAYILLWPLPISSFILHVTCIKHYRAKEHFQALDWINSWHPSDHQDFQMYARKIRPPPWPLKPIRVGDTVTPSNRYLVPFTRSITSASETSLFKALHMTQLG